MKILRQTMLLMLVLAAGCSGLTVANGTPTQVPAPTATSTSPSAPQITNTPAGPKILKIWLPPQFDPELDEPASQILKARLEEFNARRPDVRVEVRIKALDGAGGLLDSLTTANSAAPLALPDLVALPRPIMETAALKGLLRSFDEVTGPIEQSDWYEFARELGRLQDSTFGLPFAGDVLILVYRSTVITEPPTDLNALLQMNGPLAFPAADPQSLTTLALYQSSGGAIQDEEGRPTLQVAPLTEVFTFYNQAATSALAPFWLTQYQSDGQAWEAFLNNQAEMVITWTSRYLNNIQADFAATPLPTTSGNSYTLATGWVWALATTNPDHYVLSSQLAEFLSESNFQARWTTALGYLPTRESAMNAWGSTTLRSFSAPVVESARLVPSEDLLTIIGPPLQQAAVQVLKLEAEPDGAAQTAVEGLSGP
ncbi:MAG: extracellular solute-binding protein [Anaerolineales bacterium]|nr:MAG: extracellular solute-binding protein [Anaerolineales bacterium]